MSKQVLPTAPSPTITHFTLRGEDRRGVSARATRVQGAALSAILGVGEKVAARTSASSTWLRRVLRWQGHPLRLRARGLGVRWVVARRAAALYFTKTECRRLRCVYENRVALSRRNSLRSGSRPRRGPDRRRRTHASPRPPDRRRPSSQPERVSRVGLRSGRPPLGDDHRVCAR